MRGNIAESPTLRARVMLDVNTSLSRGFDRRSSETDLMAANGARSSIAESRAHARACSREEPRFPRACDLSRTSFPQLPRPEGARLNLPPRSPLSRPSLLPLPFGFLRALNDALTEVR